VVADFRINWGSLMKKLGSSVEASEPAKKLLKRLKSIYPQVDEIPSRVPRTTKPKRDLNQLLIDEGSLALFMADLMAALPTGFEAFPTQDGNSPPLMRIGKADWASWFRDHDGNRVTLNIDMPRPTKRAKELHFHFCISLFSKTYSGFKKPSAPEKISLAAKILNNTGFEIIRNTPGKHSPGISFEPPYFIGSSGFFWANGFDNEKHTLWLSQASRLGWDGSIQKIITNFNRVSRSLDRICKNNPEYTGRSGPSF
jgi:hypothetical protein